MIYEGTTKTIDNVELKVRITTSKTPSTTVTIDLADDPIEIEMSSEGLYTPIKPLSATIRLVSNDIYKDMFSPVGNDVKVSITRAGSTIFQGYISPNLYTQDWKYLNVIELECISRLSYAEYVKYDVTTPSIKSIRDIIRTCLIKTGYTSSNYFYLPQTFNYNATNTTFFEYVSLDENNFIDNDEEKTKWTVKEVLNEICKTFNLSIVESGYNVYFINYDYLNSATINYFTRYVCSNTSTARLNTSKTISNINLGINTYNSENQNIEFEECYSKFNVIDNLYPIEYNNDFEKDLTECTNADFPWYDNGISYFSSLDVKKGITTIQTNLGELKELCMVKYYTHPQFDCYDSATASTTDYSPLYLCNGIHVKYAKYYSTDISGGKRWQNNEYKDCIQAILNGGRTDRLFTYKTKFKGIDSFNHYINLDWTLIINCVGYDYRNFLRLDDPEYYGPAILSTDYSNFKNSEEGKTTWQFCYGKVKDGYQRYIKIKVKCGDYYLSGRIGSLNGTDPYNGRGNSNITWTTDNTSTVKWFIDLENDDDKEQNVNGTRLKMISNIEASNLVESSNGCIIPLFNENTIAKNGDEIEISVYDFDNSPVLLKWGGGVVKNKVQHLTRSSMVFEDFKCDIVKSNPSLTDVIKKEEDVKYTNIDQELYLKEYSDVELKINTQQDNKEDSYSSLIHKNNSGVFTYVTDVYDTMSKETNPVEEKLITQYYNHFNQAKIKLNCDIVFNSDVLFHKYIESNLSENGLLVDSYIYNPKGNNYNVNLIEV